MRTKKDRDLEKALKTAKEAYMAALNEEVQLGCVLGNDAAYERASAITTKAKAAVEAVYLEMAKEVAKELARTLNQLGPLSE